MVNNECSAQTNIKEDVEGFRKMRQVKYDNKTTDVGEQKTLVNIEDALFSIIIGIPINK